MKIWFLGSGTIVPTAKRSYSSIIVEVASEKILVDVGPATLYKICRSGMRLDEIDHLLLTHFHIDHVADYLPLLHSKAFNPEIGEMEPKGRLRVYGPRGLITFTRDLLEKVEPWSCAAPNIGRSEFLDLSEVEAGMFGKEPGWTGYSAPVQHAGGVAYRVESGDLSVTCSGDTLPDRNLVELAKQTDLLIHECSFPSKDLLVGLHTTASDLGLIAADAECRRLVLTHLYPVCEGRIDEMVRRISEDYDGEVIVAEDYMQLSV